MSMSSLAGSGSRTRLNGVAPRAGLHTQRDALTDWHDVRGATDRAKALAEA